MRERNIEVVRKWIEEAWSGGNLAVADDLLAEEFVLHDPVAGREVVGREAERALVAGLREAIPDLTFTIDDVVADGDNVTIRWIAEGTHGGELLGFASTGRALAIRGVDMYRLREGRIAESWTFWDLPGMLRTVSAPAAA
ncbi:MAG: hypothetical protein QOJ68_2125 [Blastococcus sp.]|jgi:steroid delta-isomerase-like uncharacterized protein|nr:hypothetical protein [Blastococcus sp.]